MGYCPCGKICSKEIWRSRVCGTRNQNLKEAKVENELRELPRKDGYEKTLLPSELDDKALQMMKNMRQAGSVVSYNNAIAVGKENGGSLNLNFSWCQ